MKHLFVTAVILAMSVSAATAKEAAKQMNVAIFVYEGVEILDFGGPGEVFASARVGDTHESMTAPFNVYTVAAKAGPVVSQRFITVVPGYTIENCPKPDVIVLPGGNQGPSADDPGVIAWVQAAAKDDAVLMSVCTGAFILARAGLLDGKEATTWYGAIDRLKEAAPKTTVHTATRFVDNGNIVTTAGVSAGIDGALHVVARLCGIEVARGVAKYMEYDRWQEKAGLIVQK